MKIFAAVEYRCYDLTEQVASFRLINRQDDTCESPLKSKIYLGIFAREDSGLLAVRKGHSFP